MVNSERMQGKFSPCLIRMYLVTGQFVFIHPKQPKYQLYISCKLALYEIFMLFLDVKQMNSSQYIIMKYRYGISLKNPVQYWSGYKGPWLIL